MATRVLITGMSGTGKSSVVGELTARGFAAVDVDEAGFSEEVDVDQDEVTGLGGGRDWVWREDRVREVLDTDGVGVLFVSGTSPNQGSFYPRFDHIVLLTAPPEVLVERLATRTNNPFGKEPGEVERVLEMRDTIEPLLRRGATLEIETTVPLGEVVDAIIDHVGG